MRRILKPEDVGSYDSVMQAIDEYVVDEIKRDGRLSPSAAQIMLAKIQVEMTAEIHGMIDQLGRLLSARLPLPELAPLPVFPAEETEAPAQTAIEFEAVEKPVQSKGKGKK